MNTLEETRAIDDPHRCISQRDLVRVLVAERVKVLAYIDSLVRDEDLSEDLFQEICMLAVEKSRAIKDELHLVKWLRTTARFRALNALQKRQQRNLSLSQNVLDQLESKWRIQDGSDSSDRADALRQCAERLPARAKDLIQKRFVDGMNYEQLSKSVGRPVKSVYVTFSRIFTSLGNCVMERLAASEGNPRG